MKTYWQYLWRRYLIGLMAITPLLVFIFVEGWDAVTLLIILFVNVVVNIRSTLYAKARIPKIAAIMGRDYVTDDNDLAAAYALRVQAKIYLAVGAVIWLLILCFGHVVWQSELFDSLWWAVLL